MKKNIIFMLIIITIISIESLIYAANENVTAILNKEVSIIYNNEIKSFFDVNQNQVYPISYEGTTYLPIRAISSMFEIPVLWDGASNKIYLGSGDLSSTTAKSIEKFEKGNSENKNVILNKDIKIEYKETIQTFADANGKTVYPISYEGTTYLPVRAISNLYGAEISWDGTKNQITITRENKITNITSVVIKVIDDVACAVITTDTPIGNYNYFSLEDPNRLILDLENSRFAINKNELNINYKGIQKVRFGVQENNISRIVLDLDTIDSYTVNQSADKKTTYLALSSAFDVPQIVKDTDVLVASIDNNIHIVHINSEETTKDLNEENIVSISGEIAENNDTTVVDAETLLTEEELAKLAKVTAVTYSSTTTKTKIKISGKYEYKITPLEGSSQIALDIMGSVLNVDGPTEITPKKSLISSINFIQYKQDVVRIIFETISDATCTVSKKSGYIEASIEKEVSSDNVEYEAFENYATLRLKDVKKKVFSTSVASKTNKYTMTFSSTKFETLENTLNINDAYVETVTISKSKIIIKGRKNVEFSMKQDGDDTIVTIKNKQDKFVVLLDAGHGGKDPGACNGSAQEKVYNLEIMLKVKEFLEDEDDIEVITSRTKDVYIDRQGRIDFVWDNIEDANILVSVHNNSTTNKNYNGTLVLYYNKDGEKEDYGITSKELATIVKSHIVEETDLVDRGFLVGDYVWILTQNNMGEISESLGEDMQVTNLPGILCEVCCMSNEGDLAMLNDEDFIEDVAYGIYQGILEAKDVIEK